MPVRFFILAATLFAALGLGDVDVDNEIKHSRELNVTELGYYVNTDEGRSILENDFKNIKNGMRRPWTVALRPENIWKNRYHDLLAFDETRVVLENRSNESDYINANYINGYHGEKEYVATQGPLPNTTDDFWAMIWQLNTTKIVMLANLIEHGEEKVAKYWSETSDTYGDINVTKFAEYPMPQIKHLVRTFLLKKDGVLQPRVVYQFHYTGWPDMGVPHDRMSVVALMHQIRKYRPDNTVPIVIHCSAGVGRTGTVILMDSMIQRAEAEGTVDFPKRLDHMRVQRVDVVEKKEQYIFAHQGVYDLFNRTASEKYLSMVDDLYRSGFFGADVPDNMESAGSTPLSGA